MPVAGEEYAFADVLEIEHGHDEPLCTQSPSCMRRHAVAERVEIELECIGIEAFRLDLADQQFIDVAALGTGGEFHSRVHHVERSADFGSVLKRHGVERSRG